jgi:hypothetical protein
VPRKYLYTVSVVAVLSFAVWLRWPTVHNGFFSDDIVAMAMAKNAYGAPRAPLDLFSFAAGTPDDQQRLLQYGSLPWWTIDGLRLAMLRPLASVTTLADHAVFGMDAYFCHVHSTLWWIGLLLATAVLYRDLFPPRMAVLALLLFALKEGHTFTLGWLANRGGLMAMLFCLLALRAHLRWRRGGDRRAAWSSAGWFSLALLSGEWAVPLMAYVFAFEVMRRGVPWRERAVGLVPAALPTLIFGIVRGALGFGARNSGVYTDPIAEPLRFLRMIFERLPVFFADAVFGVPSTYYGFGTPWRDRLLASGLIPTNVWLKMPGWPLWHLVIGSFAIIAVAFAFWRILPSRPLAERKELDWLLLGGFLSLLPMVSSFPHSRVVIPAALAFAPAVASLLFWCWERAQRALRERRFGRGLVPVALAAAVLYFQVWSAGNRSYYEARDGSYHFASIRSLILDAEVDFSTLADKRVVLMSVIDHTAMVFAPYVLWLYGKPKPRSWWTLTAAPYATEWYRPAPNVLELSTLGGPLLQSEMEQLYRAERFQMHVGQIVSIDGFNVEIVQMNGQFPQTVRFTFDKSIDDPSYLFLYPSPEGLGRARLPEVGERLIYRKASFGNEGLQAALRAGRDPNVTCVGPAPTLAQCRAGFAFSDCGGSGEPVFACNWQNDCRWFLHGCVAEEYAPSACAPADICCEHGWPYDRESFTHDAPYDRRLYETLRAWGRKGFELESDEVLDVWIEPALESRRPELHCLGPHSEGGPCGLGELDMAAHLAGSIYLTFRGAEAAGWALTLEVLDDRAGTLGARVCRVPTPPLPATEPLIAECAPPMEPVCADAGSVTLNMFPIYPGLEGELRGRILVSFPDGMEVDGMF